MKPEIRIDNWRLVEPVLEGDKRLLGDVSDHPKIGAGNGIRTSQIVVENIEGGWIETNNTRYLLGQPMPEDKAKETLFEDLAGIYGHVGLAQDDCKVRLIPVDQRCDRCSGTGNQLYGMYQQCEKCAGTGRTPMYTES